MTSADGFDKKFVPGDLWRENLDRASEGGISPNPRSASALHFDSFNPRNRQSVPENPAPKRVVLRYSVAQHQGPPCPIRAYIAQTYPLRGRMCHPAATAAEQTESGNATQYVVQASLWRRIEVITPQDFGRKRTIINVIIRIMSCQNIVLRQCRYFVTIRCIIKGLSPGGHRNGNKYKAGTKDAHFSRLLRIGQSLDQWDFAISLLNY